MTIRRVPSNLNTTGKVGMVSIGYTASTKPSSNIMALFWRGITRFLQIHTCGDQGINWNTKASCNFNYKDGYKLSFPLKFSRNYLLHWTSPGQTHTICTSLVSFFYFYFFPSSLCRTLPSFTSSWYCLFNLHSQLPHFLPSWTIQSFWSFFSTSFPELHIHSQFFRSSLFLDHMVSQLSSSTLFLNHMVASHCIAP